MLPNPGKYLTALGKRGHAATILDGQLRYIPALPPHLQRQADAAAETIRAEITRRWNDADAEMDTLTASGLSDDDLFSLCLYEARKAVATPTDDDPCPNCTETLFWRRQDEDGLPCLCYSCHEPEDDVIGPGLELHGGAR